MKAKKLQKEVVTLKDGRYLIYYSWAKGSEGRGSEGQKVRCLRAEDGGQKTVKLYRNN